MDIIPKLSLNKHPKDLKTNSLVNAENVKLSNDFSCLQSEESILINPTISEFISTNHPNSKIIGCIPCTKELIIFIEQFNDVKNYKEGVTSTIIRYDEDRDECKCSIDNLLTHGGKIKGTFTYNVNNELIIAFTEVGHDESINVPLKTINLSTFDADVTEGDLGLSDELFSACPEVNIPSINNMNYVDGVAYKGWYELFIRYKINKSDYTNWFNIGHKILIDTLEKRNIIKILGYGLNPTNTKDGVNFTPPKSSYTLNTDYSIFATGCVDNINDNKDICTETIKFDIKDIDERYKNYQIGFICTSKSYNKAYISNDISTNVTSVLINYNDYKECSPNDIIITTYNYFNVKTLCNYQNRVYIGNYKESINYTDLQYFANNIKLSYSKELKTYDDIRYIPNENANDDFETNIVGENLTITCTSVAGGSMYIPTLHGVDESLVRENKYKNCYILDSENNVYRVVNYKWAAYAGNPEGSIELTFSINNKYYFYKFYTETKNPIYSNFTHTIHIESNINNYKRYINTSTSFKDRRLDNTLIPGNVYNFFIHFVNKYGEATPGYQIPCTGNTIYLQNNYIITDAFCMKWNDGYTIHKVDDTLYNEDGSLNVYEYVYEKSVPQSGRKVFAVLEDETSINNINTEILNAINISTVSYTYWTELFNANSYSNGMFVPYINKNGEHCHKLPYSETIDKPDLSYDKNLSAYLYKLNVEFKFRADLLKQYGYEGYYLSYEKFEPSVKYTGLLCKSDYNDNQYEDGSPLKDYNNSEGNKLYFYSSQLDIKDSIDLKVNYIRVISYNYVDGYSSTTANKRIDNSVSNKYYANLNQIDLHRNYSFKYYRIDKLNIAFGGDYNSGRNNLGTVLEIESNIDIFNDNPYTQAKVELISIDDSLYANKEKTLIKFTDTIYNFSPIEIQEGLNGFITYNNFLVYNSNGVILHDATNTIMYNKFKPYNWFDVASSNKFLIYCQMVQYANELFETKEFNNNPKRLAFRAEPISTEENQIIPQYVGCFVDPKDSIDLFKNRFDNPDSLTSKTYINYLEDSVNLSNFTHTVRRTNIIQDESTVNAWRQFPVEGYKIIAENKGEITNVIGIGTLFLVHTEHSLFMLDRDNTLNTKDKSVSLVMPDIFDIDYKEIVTSELGRCGLQEYDAWIIDKFGYIFYDTDENRFYRFDNKSVSAIDVDIVNYLNKYKPKYIQFANDSKSNRLLISYKINIDNYNNHYTISYNYETGTFISSHKYVFLYAYNTKNVLYLIYNNNIHIFDYNNKYSTGFNDFDCITNEGYSKSKVDIIINDEYELIKTLEFIFYKLYKININDTEYILNDIESHKEPYSGEILRVFNNIVDTKNLDIKISNEQSKNLYDNWTKPRWDLTNWNFNYLRNNNTDFEATLNSRLYGNYFIISLTFGDGIDKCELETLFGRVIRNR